MDSSGVGQDNYCYLVQPATAKGPQIDACHELGANSGTDKADADHYVNQANLTTLTNDDQSQARNNDTTSNRNKPPEESYIDLVKREAPNLVPLQTARESSQHLSSCGGSEDAFQTANSGQNSSSNSSSSNSSSSNISIGSTGCTGAIAGADGSAMNAATERRYRPQKFCAVCGDKAIACNFNAVTCESCKAFFRRNAYKEQRLKCLFENRCTIDRVTRRFCSKCRLLKCFQIGMKREWILTDEQKHIKKVKIMLNKQSRQQHRQQQLVPNSNQTQSHDISGLDEPAPMNSSSSDQANGTNFAQVDDKQSSPSSSSSGSSSPVDTYATTQEAASSLARPAGGRARMIEKRDAATLCELNDFEPYGRNLAAKLVHYCSLASQCQYCSLRLTSYVPQQQPEAQLPVTVDYQSQQQQQQYMHQQQPSTTQQVVGHHQQLNQAPHYHHHHHQQQRTHLASSSSGYTNDDDNNEVDSVARSQVNNPNGTQQTSSVTIGLNDSIINNNNTAAYCCMDQHAIFSTHVNFQLPNDK